MISGEINGKVSADLAIRSPSHYCNQGQSVQADALFLQGFRTLFPVNQRDQQLAVCRQERTRLLPHRYSGWSFCPGLLRPGQGSRCSIPNPPFTAEKRCSIPTT